MHLHIQNTNILDLSALDSHSFLHKSNNYLDNWGLQMGCHLVR